MINILSRNARKSKIINQKIQETFFAQYYQAHNVARLSHLESLGLDIANKTVFEFGAGVGDHSYYYLIKNCKVTASDSRPELVNFIKNRWGIDTVQIDIEKDIEKIKNFPKYDIIHCYGILYHVGNPKEFLEALKGKCSLFLLETCVSSDEKEDGVYIVDENKASPTQANSGKGCRPTRNWIFEKLKTIFPYVYIPVTQPNHHDFPKNWNVKLDEDKLKRAVFIGSMTPIVSDKLVTYLPKEYK